MKALDLLILEAMRGPDPPQTVDDLAARCSAGRAYTYSRISELIKAGELLSSECPWRRRSSADKAKSGHLADLERHLESIIRENGRDRVSALRELRELRTMGGTLASPPSPGDRHATAAALARMLQSAGLDISKEAISIAFPDETITNLAVPTPSGGNLD